MHLKWKVLEIEGDWGRRECFELCGGFFAKSYKIYLIGRIFPYLNLIVGEIFMILLQTIKLPRKSI